MTDEARVWDYNPLDGCAPYLLDDYPAQMWPTGEYRVVYPPLEPTPIYPQTQGWICPVCGRGKAPQVLECPCMDTGTDGGTSFVKLNPDGSGVMP
jgi:hypothetical protein